MLILVIVDQAHAAETTPNNVFIFADDWGWGDLSCHGHPWLKTPNLDRLASEGTDFRQFNVLNPVCSPSRTAVMKEDAKCIELYQLHDDRAESKDIAKDHPDVVARLTRLALDWKATLPAKPNPACITTVPDAVKNNLPKTGAKGVTPEVRAKAFTRWDTNQDDILTLDEYESGLKGQNNLEARFKSFDTDGDGKLTRDELVR